MLHVAGEASAVPDDPRPRLNADAFVCPQCNVFAHQYWSNLTAQSFSIETEQRPDGTARALWKAALCKRCGKPSIWRDGQMLYPLQRLGDAPHELMPEPVRELYEEAAAVAMVSRRAGAALARATVERLLKHLDPDAKQANLETRIERISQRVSTPLGQQLDIVRIAGNGAVHPKDEPDEIVVIALSDEDGPALLELLLDTANQLVDELIARPARTQNLWDRLPQWLKDKRRPAEESQEIA